MALRSQKTTIPLLLLVWFFIWGICPWSNSSAVAQQTGATHAKHGHHEVDDTHHASKGTEHSCSGSISLSKNNLKSDRPLCANVFSENISLSTDLGFRPNHNHDFLRHLFERSTLPKLLAEYYQLYSVYRI